ncbi:hypothetical protein LguiA_008617 [Lonicera macranthoides]
MVVLLFFLHLLSLGFVSSEVSFIYNGFKNSNLSLDGAAYLRSDGILVITKDIPKLLGHALYPFPLRFKENKPNNKSSAVTFSTNFVFSINPKYSELGGHGLAFVLLSTKQPKGCLPNQYLGLPNYTTSSDVSTRMLGVEFDVVQNLELQDINDNHVGIDISSLISNISEPVAVFLDNTTSANNSFALKSGDPFQVWIDYNSQEMLMNVTIAPLGHPRPYRPLISLPIDLSSVIDEFMYVGFSASTGLLAATHNLLGWSFRIGGKAQELDLIELPSLIKSVKVVHRKGFVLGMTLASLTLLFLILSGATHVIHRIKNGKDILEDWEVEYGARRFKYSDLLAATRGFGERNLVGSGGFGKVYKGVIPKTGLEVAIKRVAQDSQQGMREFVAEITSMGRLRHRNLVQLHGWCRRENELLLVYDYVPNGSLDDLLFSNPQQKKKILTWDQRYKILIGVAQALLYLHEECDNMVVHRDVKPSNVLIDADLEAKLGDFGLARTYQHGVQTQTTHIVGTLGYLAPELTRTGKATSSSDVYGYGALMLEVACGRRPIEPQRGAQELILVDWVRKLQSRGKIVQAVDATLEEYNTYEAEVVLCLGLRCTHHHPDHRPSMRRVVQVMLGDASLPQLPTNLHRKRAGVITEHSGFYADESDPSSSRETSSKSTTFSSFDKKISGIENTRVTF